MTVERDTGMRRGMAWTIAAVLAVTFLPFARGTLRGESFYFRDLSGQFFPLRRFVVEGVLRGELRYWNPLVHEGEPLALPPVSYPIDLLQVFAPDERGFSWLLAAHVPLAALAFLCLARGLGASSIAAAGGALIYALGGFSLSCLNLYVLLQAAAWAPLVVLGLLKSATGGPRNWAMAAVATAVALSTTGVEIVAQAIVFGLVLSASTRDRYRWMRLTLSLVLGCGLAAPTLMVVAGLVADSARGEGFATNIVLSHSIHPLTFAQVVIGSFHGDLSNLTGRWWGQRFFPQGFPYLISLYLGATTLCLAVLGASQASVWRRRLAGLALFGIVVSLGRYASLGPVVDAVPWLHSVRYPSKAFFSVHLATALLATLGLEALRARPDSAWRRLSLLALVVGLALVALVAFPAVLPSTTQWFITGFFPSEYPSALKIEYAGHMLRDAATGGFVVLAVGSLAGLAAARRLDRTWGILALVALLAADLIRAGAGLNPTASPSFFDLSPEMSHWALKLRNAGRVFSCDPELNAELHRARQMWGRRQDTGTFAAYIETLTPFHNMGAGIATAYSRDRTMLVPLDQVLSPAEASCATFPSIANRLQSAGVAHVLSLTPLDHPSLRLQDVVHPRRVDPLGIHVYSLESTLPLVYLAENVRAARSAEEAAAFAREAAFSASGAAAVEGIHGEESAATHGRIGSVRETPGDVELRVEADGPTVVVVRTSWARGWSARVNGSPAAVLRADGRYQAVRVQAGASSVSLSYSPPGLEAGLTLGAVSLLTTLGLLVLARGRRLSARAQGGP